MIALSIALAIIAFFGFGAGIGALMAGKEGAAIGLAVVGLLTATWALLAAAIAVGVSA